MSRKTKKAAPAPKLEVWWIPQVPMKAFTVPVRSIEEARLLLDVLANYDRFQFENNIKPDYSNAGGLSVWEDDDWAEWYDEEGEDIDSEKYERKAIP